MRAMTKTSAVLVALLAIVAGVAMAACGDDGEDQPTADEAAAALCADLSDLTDAITALRDIRPSSAIDDLRQAREGIREALDNVEASGADVRDARISDIENAFDDLDETINNISDDMSLQEALSAVLDDITSIATATGDLFSSLNC